MCVLRRAVRQNKPIIEHSLFSFSFFLQLDFAFGFGAFLASLLPFNDWNVATTIFQI
jgi:hypothetical protein